MQNNCFCEKSIPEISREKGMKILLVSNQIFTDGRVSNPVLTRMGDSMRRDIRVEGIGLMPVEYSINGLMAIRKAARESDITHIHFGGIYALVVWLFLVGVKRPKLITFHGTDIHAKAIKTEKKILSKVKIKLNQFASFLSILAFDKVGFVAQEMENYVPSILKRKLQKKAFLQSLGVDYDTFSLMEQSVAKEKLQLNSCKYALFSTISNTNIKRQDIAEAIIKEMGARYELLVMCGVRPGDVPVYINACDFLLLTSDEEGSPNIIRECLALNKPVFSVNVGDAALQLDGLNNSRIIGREPLSAARVILESLDSDYTDNTREVLRNRLDFDCLNKKVIDIYASLIDR